MIRSGTLSHEDIEQVLQSQSVGRIGCCARHRPYVVPVAYAYDGVRVFCHSVVGDKIRIMRDNPEVCFEVEQIDSLNNWRSVIASGTYEELKGHRAARAMNFLVNRLTPLATCGGHDVQKIVSTMPLAQNSDRRDTVVYCVHLRDKTGRFGDLALLPNAC